MNKIKNWYVLHTKSRFEQTVEALLIKKKIDVFLPMVSVLSKRKDRKKIIKAPMFPGYVFVLSENSSKSFVKIIKTNGAVKLLSTKKGPHPVKNDTIKSLKLLSDSEEKISIGNGHKKGDKVIIINGPLTGVEGVYKRKAGNNKIYIQIDMLGQYASANVKEEDIKFFNEDIIITT